VRTILLLAVLLLAHTLWGRSDDEFVIYTSIYQRVIDRMKPHLEEEFPGVEFEWRRMGSEQLAVKLGVELETGGTRCDLLMTSDPFFYAQLADASYLLEYLSPAAAGVPAALKDTNHAWATVRVPLMVLAVNHERLAKADHPCAFKDLMEARFRGKVAMGDPLKSGTTFTTVAALVKQYGWRYFEALRRNDVQSAGGNSTVTNKLETGERPVGIVLLENLLPALARGAPITVIYPADGAVPVPSPVAILAGSDQPALARKVYDFLFSAAIQEAIVSGFMYSPVPGRAPPEGARPWDELALFEWNAAFVAWVKAERKTIKSRFRSIMRD